MIKEKDLREFRNTYRYADGTQISLQGIQQALKDKAMQYQIPVEFSSDQIKSGGLLSPQTDDCLVLQHPEHRNDYFKFAVCVRRQGVMAFVSVNDFGNSKNMNKMSHSSVIKGNLKTGLFSSDPNESARAIGAAIGHGLRALGGSKAKQQQEEMYYSVLMQIFDEVIC